MSNKTLLAITALSMGAIALNAETKFTANITTVTPGTPAEVAVSLVNESACSGIDMHYLKSEGVTISGVKVLASTACTLDENNVGEYYVLTQDDYEEEFKSEELFALLVTLEPGYSVGTVTVYDPDESCYGTDAEALPEPIQPLVITVVASDYALGTNGYSSFSSATATKVTGATAYYVAVDGDVAKLTAVEGNVVPANTGVILKGNEGDVVTFAPNADVAAGANELSASVSGASVSGVHVLGTKSGETGFYKYTGTEIGAGKAYLEGVTLSRVLFDTETGIENVELNNIEAIFNLQGQKLNETKKGINIVNGKKVMF